MTTPQVRIVIEVVNGTPAVTTTTDTSDHDREQIVHWMAEARAQRERAEKFEGWLKKIVASRELHEAYASIDWLSIEMRKDGLL